MLIATASLFAVGAALFVWDFFRYAPRSEAITEERGPQSAPATA